HMRHDVLAHCHVPPRSTNTTQCPTQLPLSRPRRPPSSPLFPYTTLFRSGPLQLDQLEAHGLEPGVELSLERIPVHGSPSIKKWGDRKSTRLNSSHVKISYAVFCLKKKKIHTKTDHPYQCTPYVHMVLYIS